MISHRWFLLVGAVSGLAICNTTTAAETQRIGLPAGYYKIPAGGRLRIGGYCMDQNVPAPAVDLAVSPISRDDDKLVTPRGGTSVRLNKAVADRMLDFKTHERSFNDYLEQTEHSTDHLPVPEGAILFKWKFDPPGADTETGRLRTKFGELPLSEAMQEIHRYRMQAGASPKSATNLISLAEGADEQLSVPRINNNSEIPPSMLMVGKYELDPRQIILGATVTNHTNLPILLEVGTPLILSTNPNLELENIDPSRIKTAKGYVGREKTQQQIWEANETLAAAHSRDYQHYLTRFDLMPAYRGHIVRGLVHDNDAALVYVDKGNDLEVRRVKDNVQEVIQRGPDAEKAFEQLPRQNRGDRKDPPAPPPKKRPGAINPDLPR